MLGAAAITTTVVLAFLVPLALAVRTLAADRALSDAEQSARSVATVFALVDDESLRMQALGAADAATAAALTAHLAGGATLGVDRAPDDHVRRAFSGAAFGAPAPGGQQVLVPVVRGAGTEAVIQAHVPSAVLRRGVSSAWLLLALLGVALVGVAVLVADWLGRAVVTPVRALASTAQELGAGQLDSRVEPDGPEEVAEVGRALNGLAARITQLLAAERELVADLSHRLRTPLTALRLDADAVRDPVDAERLRADVDAVERTVSELIREARTPPGEPSGEVDASAVVRERAEFWGALAEDQARDWRLDISEGVAPVSLHRADVETLVDALLGNVFAHTPDGTAYRVGLDGSTLVVEDAGPGFAADDPLARGHSGAGSTGLGLDIVRKIAQRAGGAVTIGTSELGGACVAVALRPPAVHTAATHP